MPRLIVGTNWFPIKTAGRLLPVVGLTFVWNTIRDQLGARIVKTCEHSMVIRGTATDWATVDGAPLPESGDYVVSGALSPVELNRETDCGQHLVPNVWMIPDLE